MLKLASTRLWTTLVTWPDRRAWIQCAWVSVATLLTMVAIGWCTGLYRPEPGDLTALPLTAIGVFFVPALSEELVFRGLLAPSRRVGRSPWPAIGLSTLIYVAWHPLEGLTFLPGASSLFTRPDFLAVTTLLGLACAEMRWRTGSLWPAVLLHWALVVIWKTWLGGPSLESLS
jgi:predicted Abi (CAAX) family protease